MLTLLSINENKAWSIKASLGFIFLVYVLEAVVEILLRNITIGGKIIFIGIAPENIPLDSINGDLINITSLIYFFLAIPLLIYFAKGVTINDKLAYLALNKLPNKKTVLIFIGLFILYHIFDNWLAQYSSNVIPEIILEVIRTTNFIFIACFTTVVTVPIIEEVIFRGFLFKAIQTSKYGAIGAILITSLLFTLMHAYQYDPLDLIEVFISALIFGYARFISNSLYLPILLHMLQNLIGTIFLVDYIRNIPA